MIGLVSPITSQRCFCTASKWIHIFWRSESGSRKWAGHCGDHGDAHLSERGLAHPLPEAGRIPFGEAINIVLKNVQTPLM